MLTRRGRIAALVALALLVVTAPIAYADTGGGVTCPPDLPACVVVVTGSGQSGLRWYRTDGSAWHPRLQGADDRSR